MSEVGHSRRFDRVQLTSGLTPQADIIADRRHVSKVPQADSCAAANRHLFDRLISADEERFRVSQPERAGSGRVDNQVGIGRLLDRKSPAFATRRTPWRNRWRAVVIQEGRSLGFKEWEPGCAS
jgi:hypothetical protein